MNHAWELSSAVGGFHPNLDCAFFRDKSRVAVATALAIKIYSLATNQVVTKIPIDCSNSVQLYLTKEEDRILLVKKSGLVYELELKASHVSKLDLGKKISYIISNSKNTLMTLYSTPEGPALGVFAQDVDGVRQEEQYLFKGADQFAISQSGQYVVAAQCKAKETLLQKFHIPTKVSSHFKRDRKTHSIAISNKGLVAVGAPSGVIDLYYEKGIRALKWHLEEVTALKFTPDDNYLLSGGKERVMVFWQLDGEKQQFLPRLNGAITRISINHNNSLYGLTLDDTQLVVISAVDLLSRLKVSGIKACFSKLPDIEREKRKRKKSKSPDQVYVQSDYTTSMCIQPSTKHLYMITPALKETSNLRKGTSDTGSQSGTEVQMYSIAEDQELNVISVAQTLQQGKVRSEMAIQDTSTQHLIFSADGDWMITVDVFEASPIDDLLSKGDVQISLKFWQYQPESMTFTLKTRIVSPHGENKHIRCVVSAPYEPVVLTAAEDGSVRLWKPNRDTGEWTLRRVSDPFGFTSKAVTLAYSNDASLVAIGFETTIHLLNARTLRPESQLTPLTETRVRFLGFLGKYIVLLSKTRLVVWDLVRNELQWEIQVGQQCLNARRLIVVEPTENKIVLAYNYWTQHHRIHSKLLLFDVHSPLPEALYEHKYAISNVKVVPGTSSVVFIDVRGVLNTIGSSIPTVEAGKKSFTSILVDLQHEAQTREPVAVDEDEAQSKVIDVNSFNRVFEDDSTNIGVLFERVLGVIAK